MLIIDVDLSLIIYPFVEGEGELLIGQDKNEMNNVYVYNGKVSKYFTVQNGNENCSMRKWVNTKTRLI